MVRPKTLVALVGFTIAMLPLPTNATWVLDAEPLVERHSAFQIQFDDLNGDQRFTAASDAVTYFSGVTIWTNFRSTIYTFANIPGITTGCEPPTCAGGLWVFGDEGEGHIVAYATDWKYVLTGPPVPPTSSPTFMATATATATRTRTPSPTFTLTPATELTPTVTPTQQVTFPGDADCNSRLDIDDVTATETALFNPIARALCDADGNQDRVVTAADMTCVVTLVAGPR